MTEKFLTTIIELSKSSIHTIQNLLLETQPEIEQLLDTTFLSELKSQSLLKLLLYESIIQIDEGDFISDGLVNSPFKQLKEGKQQVQIVKEIKRMMSKALRRKERHKLNHVIFDVNDFEQISTRLESLENQLKWNKKSVNCLEVEDEDKQILIEQLEQIIEKKVKRIEQLNEQLEENFLDHKEYEERIEDLQEEIQQLKQENQSFKKKLFEGGSLEIIDENIRNTTSKVNQKDLSKTRQRTQKEMNLEEALNFQESSVREQKKMVDTGVNWEEEKMVDTGVNWEEEEKTVKKTPHLEQLLCPEEEEEINLLETNYHVFSEPEEEIFYEEVQTPLFRQRILLPKDQSFQYLLLTQALSLEQCLCTAQ